MKNHVLLIRYILMYICVFVLSFTCVSIFSYKMDYDKLFDKYSDSMYKQAISISNEYCAQPVDEQNLALIRRNLRTVSNINHTRIMLTDTNGNVVLDTGYDLPAVKDNILYTINDFNYTNYGPHYSQTGNLHGVFAEDTLSVFAPINNNFKLKGYVIVNIPVSFIDNEVYVTFNTNYFTLLIVMLLSLGFVVIYAIYVQKPLTGIQKAINEYGKGNLSYRIKKPKHNDEIGRLAVSLDYMASELNEMDQFQQKFLSNISHDFRSPLTSIKGYLEAIADGTIPPEMINKYIDIVLFETDRLTKLTSNILTLNELDPKSVVLEMSTFDVNSIVKHTIETFEGRCKKKNIRFELTLPSETVYVKADKGKIQQVIYNLIDNAIKFSSDNSVIYIAIRQRSDTVYISVKDTGSGIAKEDIDKIWNRFYKSDSSRGKDKKGSGLGLSITKEIIQAHNEHIDVISTPGVGTEFTFTLHSSNEVDEDDPHNS